jgi:hypothetical protein
MRNRAGTQGHALAAAGGAGLAASLWLPWYTISFPQSALDSLSQMSRQLGALGPLVRSGAALIGQLGPFHITAWQAFKTTPAVLLVVAIIGGGLALLALSDRAGNTAQLTTLAGAVGALLVGYRIAVPPGQGNFVHPAWASYLALLSSLAMLAGGILSSRDHAGLEDELMATVSGSRLASPPAETWTTAAATAGPVLSTSTEGWPGSRSVGPPGN